MNRKSRLGLTTIVFLLLLIFGLTWWKHTHSDVHAKADTWRHNNLPMNLPKGKKGGLIRYGYDLITETYKYIGPDVADKNMRYAGNNLSCQNCHLDAGTKPGGGSFVGVYDRYPSFRKRSGKVGTIEDRINGCMQRSMNGRPLPENSREMKAMVAYMKWLSTDVPSDSLPKYDGFLKITLPDRMADTLKGHQIFLNYCAQCHGPNGQGKHNGSEAVQGYQYPPLWGNQSFNDGAGMDRIITAARFIKGNMPFGVTIEHPVLSDKECYDVAAFIDSHERPLKKNLQNDYPDKSQKPVDCPYGPYADPFSKMQHKYGPFQPIEKYYTKKKQRGK